MGRFVAVGLAVALLLSACSSDDSEAELEQRNVELLAQIERLETDLEDANQQVTLLQSQQSDFESDVVKAMEEAAEALREEVEARDEIDDLNRALTEAQAERDEALEVTAQLTTAYDVEIAAATQEILADAYSYACDWGTEEAKAGANQRTITGANSIKAYRASESFAQLATDPRIRAALNLLEALGDDPLNAASDDIGAKAVECWQAEDKVVNSELYAYQSVFRQAGLDAACTHGYVESYQRTATYQSWLLEQTGEITPTQQRMFESNLQDDLEARFGSIEAFMALNESDINTQIEKCDDYRDQVHEKGPGTWNVGTEIRPGEWRAFDVSDCYWARLAVNGDIRDNHFGDGLRLSVNIRSDDGQFEISGCRFYYANP